MAVNISDKNGRALEYYIVASICKSYKVKLSDAAIRDQERDKVKFDDLEDHLRIRFGKAAISILVWLEDKFHLKNSKEILLDRLADGASVEGDVTDIRIIADGSNINLSIKHNHSAIKHQRPGSLPQQMGLLKTDPLSIRYRKEYNALTSKFIDKALIDYPDYTLFNEIKADDGEYINEKLYNPVCTLVANFLEFLKSKCASNFFTFLVGNLSFYKIIVYTDTIKILEFREIEKPNTFTAEVVGDSYVHLEFSNGWILTMRLHTASSRFDSGSLKFDTQPFKIDVPTVIIEY